MFNADGLNVVPERPTSDRLAFGGGDGGDGWVHVAGEVELIGGWAEVSLDKELLSSIDTSDYLVFVTSYGAASVFVQNRKPERFEIHVIPAPGRRRPATVQCAYQVVARRRINA